MNRGLSRHPAKVGYEQDSDGAYYQPRGSGLRDDLGRASSSNLEPAIQTLGLKQLRPRLADTFPDKAQIEWLQLRGSILQR